MQVGCKIELPMTRLFWDLVKNWTLFSANGARMQPGGLTYFWLTLTRSVGTKLSSCLAQLMKVILSVASNIGTSNDAGIRNMIIVQSSSPRTSRVGFSMYSLYL